MPCWTVRTMTLRLAAADLDLLQEAIEQELGCKVHRSGAALYFLLRDGTPVAVDGDRITVAQGREQVVERIKVAYGVAAVRRAASRFGWGVERKAPAKLLVKRRF